MRSGKNASSGFSLTEVMVAMSLSMFLLASAYATMMSLAKGSESLINYSEMNTQCRQALELFARDMRMASDVLEEDFSRQSIVIERLRPGGTSQFIRYYYIPTGANGEGHFRREEWSVYPGNPATDLLKEKVLMYDVEDLSMVYYRYNRDELAQNPLEVKHVQIEAKLERAVLGITNTNYILSARFMMRNKDVTSQ